MNNLGKQSILTKMLCSSNTMQECTHFLQGKCLKHDKCRISEKTEEQLDYILSPSNECAYLEACAGSGKTEVLGMKAALEVSRWPYKTSGIAVLTFTNEAANTIRDRINHFYPYQMLTSHYIGTFASFIHGYIAQKFGYAFYQEDKGNADKSFAIIDKSVRTYDSAWLNNYKVDFPVPSRMSPIYANQLTFRASNKKWYIYLGESDLEVSEYYNLPDVQSNLGTIRATAKKDYLFQLDYFTKKVCECKLNFWKAGFASFEDMNFIARKCLKSQDISKRLAKKFPLIIIDECQDLSFIELEILELLRLAGSSVHYIGDLNQAIYSFKDAYPDYLASQISSNGFNVLRLKDNFRSCQSIVNVACALQKIESGIIGHASSHFANNEAVYYEYDDESNSISRFLELMELQNLSVDNAIVLTRSSNLKKKLSTGLIIDYDKHAILNSIQLWHNNSQESRKHAMELLGWQIQKWLKGKGRKDNYFCPSDVCNDTFRWRLMLRDILNEFIITSGINEFTNKTYGSWYRSAKDKVVNVITQHLFSLLGQGSELLEVSWRTPSGTAATPIQILSKEESKTIKVDTIHAVKGCSYEAVLLVSSSDARGKTGFWENWIDGNDETTRFAYVASTRPKYLLCWAVPRLSDEQRTKIEAIGLKKVDQDLHVANV